MQFRGIRWLKSCVVLVAKHPPTAPEEPGAFPDTPGFPMESGADQHTFNEGDLCTIQVDIQADGGRRYYFLGTEIASTPGVDFEFV